MKYYVKINNVFKDTIEELNNETWSCNFSKHKTLKKWLDYEIGYTKCEEIICVETDNEDLIKELHSEMGLDEIRKIDYKYRKEFVIPGEKELFIKTRAISDQMAIKTYEDIKNFVHNEFNIPNGAITVMLYPNSWLGGALSGSVMCYIKDINNKTVRELAFRNSEAEVERYKWKKYLSCFYVQNRKTKEIYGLSEMKKDNIK